MINTRNDRHEMVRAELQMRGIEDQRVLEAMAQVPREEFVPAAWRDLAYADGALPISCDQTISQPYTVAFMCEAALISPNDKVLEIGTGSGYGAAVLSRLGGEVHTIERIAELADQAADRLHRLGITNVTCHRANGTLGLPAEAPFDAIVVTAGAKALPKPYLDQLRDGGRIVIPLGQLPQSQVMYRFTLQGDQLHTEPLGGFAFVPLIGQYGWSR